MTLGHDQREELRRTALYALRQLAPHGHPDFLPLLVEQAELHSVKNHDYAGSGDPLGNFKRVAAMIEAIVGAEHGPAKVALLYMAKQVDAAIDLIGHGRAPQAEGIDGRLQDIAVYATLARLLLRESTP